MGPEAAVNAVFANKIAAIDDPDEREAFVAEQRRIYEEDVDLLRLASELVDRRGGRASSDLRDELIAPASRWRGARTALQRTPPRRAAGLNVARLPVVGRRSARSAPATGCSPRRPSPSPTGSRWSMRCIDAGVRHIEVAAFVSPQGGAGHGRRGRGARRASRGARVSPTPRWCPTCGAQSSPSRPASTSSPSPSRPRRRTTSATCACRSTSPRTVVADDLRAGARARCRVDAVVSCAFGSPYEGDISRRTARRPGRAGSLDAGCAALHATPTRPAWPRRARIARAPRRDAGRDVGLHLHDTRGTALVNAYAALERGVHPLRHRRSAASAARRSPTGPAGNLATEELVALLDDCGVRTGIDIDALSRPQPWSSSLVGRPCRARVAHAGPRTRRVPAPAVHCLPPPPLRSRATSGRA